MKRLFFSVLALTIGAFAFVSCDKDDDDKKDDKREKGSYLSMQDQQDILSDALIKAGDQVEFESLAQRVRTLVYSFAGHQLNVDTTYAQLLKDELAARKIGALRDVKNISDLNMDELYFGVDLALEKSVTGLGDTVMLAMVKNINHNTDRFIINVTSADSHVLSSSLKVSFGKTGAVELTTEAGEVNETLNVNLPSLVSFAVAIDGETVIGADLNISTDYLIKAVRRMADNEQFQVESVTLNGSKLNMNGELTVGDCSYLGKVSYTDNSGLDLGVAAKVKGNEILGADVHVNAVLNNDLDYANSSSLMLLAMNNIKGLGADVRLGEDASVKAKFTKNPVMTVMPIISAGPEDMPALLDSLNNAFSCGVYFKGYKDPQAKLRFSYQAPEKSDNVPADDEDMLGMIVSSLANSGLIVVVDTYDQDGKDITVPALEYFGKIDFERFGNGMSEKFNSAFAETLAPLFHVDVEEFDLTEILKMILLNSGRQEPEYEPLD